jgi:hypothetical protein
MTTFTGILQDSAVFITFILRGWFDGDDDNTRVF